MHLIRRTFLGGLLAAIAAPAIVRAQSLMPIQPLLVPENQLIIPRTRIMGPPRCELCFGPWGMCSHTGGPMDLTQYGSRNDDKLDHRVAEIMCETDFLTHRRYEIVTAPWPPT